ncbi:MAG: helix-turn-helix domain-containing protein [Paludibacter sp.]|nr:helix-turn-helix domain-containing protein [Paludibacter sp.]
MYEQYLNLRSVPAGAILKKILQKENISQKEIAQKAAIYPQRINDLIAGKRKFTPEMSVNLAKALGITDIGYFYKIQANHEVYNYEEEQERKITPDLTIFKKSLFWDTDIRKINWLKSPKWIIQRVYEYGNEMEIKAINNFYGYQKVHDLLNQIDEKWNERNRNANRLKFAV